MALTEEPRTISAAAEQGLALIGLHAVGGMVYVLCSMRVLALTFALAVAVLDRSAGAGTAVAAAAVPLSFALMGSWFGQASPPARRGVLATDMVVAVVVLLTLTDLALVASYVAATVVLWGALGGMWFALLLIVPLCAIQFLAFDDGGRGMVIGLVGSLLTGLLAWSGATLPTRVAALAARNALPTVLGQDAARAERLRLARDLHDTVAGDLAGIALVAGRLAERLDNEGGRTGSVEMARWLDDAVRATHMQTRVVLGDLREESAGLSEAITALTARWSTRTGIPVDLDATTELDVAAGPERSRHAHAIVTELLENVRRHAAAVQVRVVASVHKGSVVVVVTDDGRGFDVEDRPPGFGVPGILERAELCQGTATWRSGPGSGTSVHVALPSEPGAQVERTGASHAYGRWTCRD